MKKLIVTMMLFSVGCSGGIKIWDVKCYSGGKLIYHGEHMKTVGFRIISTQSLTDGKKRKIINADCVYVEVTK